MNPASSVILLTTLTGAAQGLVTLLALGFLAGLPIAPDCARSALLLAEAMLAAGLAASFAHLGRPERAWRAVAMWRTSWLSREVIALPLFMAAVALWWLTLRDGGALSLRPGVMPAIALALALLLWLCTAMIYACLRFVQEWATPLTVANFVLIGLSSGAILAGAIAAWMGAAALSRAAGPWALALTLVAGGVRLLSLGRNARLRPASTLQSATGIRATPLRQQSMGMSGGAFNTREFFHGRSARVFAGVRSGFPVLAFALPLPMIALALAGGGRAAWTAALLCQWPGLFGERWFFFAQARHPQNLYYQVVS
ncbi:MAG: dimethyl sulfoxide reductase anchor subunit [Burkholderiales bacterium]|nr:dimethyl sulfoxide reductase anchor subunit [Burkholderiales bacterium]